MARFFSFIRILGSSAVYPSLWTITIILLLIIPGNAIPGMGYLGVKHLDKIIHILLFGAFVWLWGIYAWKKTSKEDSWLTALIVIVLISLGIGIAMEYVQEAYVRNRSFDVWDIWADLIGSLVFGGLLWWKGKLWGLIR